MNKGVYAANPRRYWRYVVIFKDTPEGMTIYC
jgi:hypothetical protein